MKIAILSDIHGNNHAFDAVLQHASDLNIDKYYVLGDLVGYYTDPVKVVQRVQSISNSIVIQGNHERLIKKVLQNELNLEQLNKKYGEGHKIALQDLTSDQLDWLVKLPIEEEEIIDGITIKLCHGAPGNPDLYLYPDSKIEVFNSLKYTNTNFIFVGHSHYPFIKELENCTLINVGSVGMSKDLGGTASWGVLDTENGVYIPYRTAYNYKNLINNILIKDNSNANYLISVLKRNRYDNNN